jgi:superfamily II DNA or RNA helicase
MKYTENDIKSAVSAANFIKGREYFRYGYVTECTLKTDNDALLIFSSKSRGTYESFYVQNVQMYKTFGSLKLHGTCSCPMGLNCKHVVAACLYYLNSPQKVDPKAQLDQWIANVKRSGSLVEQEAEPSSENFIIYRIYRYDSPYDQGDVKFYKTKRGKTGKINKGTQIATSNLLFGMHHHELLNEEDWVIFGLCRAAYDKYSNSVKLKKSFGYKLLKKLVESGRCYLGESEHPLCFDENEFSMVFEWAAEDLEHSRLVSNLSSDQLLTQTIPIIVLNRETNTLQIAHNLPNAQTLELLFKAPIFKNEYLIDAYESLRTQVPIPAPSGYSVETLQCAPIPHITLQKKSDGSGYVIHLAMMYEHFRFEYSPTAGSEYVSKNSKRIEIIRDKDEEYKHILTLNGFGFIRQTIDKKLYFLTGSSLNPQSALQVWNDFLTHHLKTLEEEGWIIDVEEDFTLRFEEAESISAQSEEVNDWFSLSFDLEFGGVSRPLVPLLASIITQYDHYHALPPKLNLEIEENRYVSIDTAEMEPILKTIFELFDKHDEEGNLKIGAYESHLIADLDENVAWKGSRELLELSEKLKDFKAIERVAPPKALAATLREYQQEGLDWLGFLHEFRFSGILADDMGLGKTIQTLSHLSRLKEEGKLTLPSLIIMPTSLIANWRNEAERFTPNLSALILHGNQRSDSYESIDEHDLILTTYPLITRDLEVLGTKQFEYIILDEAQKIKNPKTQMAQAIKTLQSNHRLALSGTPIENHLGELWSIFSFLMPGFLGNMSFFKEAYQTPIEKERDIVAQERFNRRIKPFVLRRTKESVALELPPKTEIIKYIQFETKQAKLYETIRSSMEKKVQEAIRSKGLGGSHITILDALLKLRQVCCDPSLLSIEEAKKVKESAKLELLMDLLEELLSEGRKILIFSQFTSMLSIIEAKLNAQKIRYAKLTGQTRKREDAIGEFTDGKAEVFLISLKAGGVGLNLTEADTVIHYDPWWNPAVENQATDRAYRIGQDKAVFVYRLIVENSIEQKILELQAKKQRIQNTIYEGEESDESALFRGEELLELLKGS